MTTVNIHHAKTHLSRLIEAAAAGEEIVIAKAGKPLVRLVPVAGTEGPRKLGALAGKVIEPDDVWAPDPAIEAAFYGAEVEPEPARPVAERPRKATRQATRRKK